MVSSTFISFLCIADMLGLTCIGALAWRLQGVLDLCHCSCDDGTLRDP